MVNKLKYLILGLLIGFSLFNNIALGLLIVYSGCLILTKMYYKKQVEKKKIPTSSDIAEAFLRVECPKVFKN